jgi:hypothetical protein
VLELGADQHAVVVDREGDVALLLARVRRRDEVLAPVLAPLDRRTEHVGGERDDICDRRTTSDRTAADVADLHADAVLGHAGRG